MYKIFHGANGEYVAFVGDDGSHRQPDQCSREANQGWRQTERLQREAEQRNAAMRSVRYDYLGNPTERR